MLINRSWVEHAWELVRDWRHSGQYPDRPESLNFEITGACDARCIHCPRLDMDRPMKQMQPELFRRLIDQAADLGVPYLCPNGYGEICTMPLPALEEYLAYMAGEVRRFKDNHRFKVVLNTNGNRMTDERARLFIKYRVHVVNVTIDGATAATAESIRRNLHFDQIEANIKHLLDLRAEAGVPRPMLRVGMVAMPQTMPEIPAFFERWTGVADAVGIGAFSTRLAAVSDTWRKGSGGAEPPGPGHVNACVLPFRDLNIWSDGVAVICCEDWNESMPAGDLKTQSLSEIWHGPVLTRAREQHRAGKGHSIDICAKCSVWHRPSRAVRLWA